MAKKIIIFSVILLIILLALGTSWYFYKNTYYYNSAIKNSNSAACLKINDDFMTATCLGNVASNIKDVALCANSSRLYIMTCLRLFASKNELINNCPDISPEVDEFNCYTAFAEEKKDVSICNTLPGEKKDYCIKSVAIVKNDVSICDSLPATSAYRETCARDVEQLNP
jgi:hypothetical protein